MSLCVSVYIQVHPTSIQTASNVEEMLKDRLLEWQEKTRIKKKKNSCKNKVMEETTDNRRNPLVLPNSAILCLRTQFLELFLLHGYFFALLGMEGEGKHGAQQCFQGSCISSG